MLAPLALALFASLTPPSSTAHDVVVAQTATKPTVAVLPLKATGLQLNEAQRLDLAVRTRFESSGRFAVQDATSTTKLLEAAQQLGLDCDVNALSCAVEIGQLADVDIVVLGAAVVIDEGTTDVAIGLDVRLIDVKMGSALRRVTGLVPRASAEMIAAANAELALLLDDGAPLAKATLTVKPDGARVVLNGVERGLAPFAAPIDGLAPGTHHLRVEREGFLPHVTRFTLGPMDAVDVDVVLVAEPVQVVAREVSTLELSIPWVVAGGGAATVVVGAVLAGVGLWPYLQFQQVSSEIDDVAQTDPSYASHVADVYARQKPHVEAWNNWGQLTTGIGATAIVVGGLVASAGAVWGLTVLVLALGDAPPSAASAPAAGE